MNEVRAVLRDLKGCYVSKGEARRFMTSLDKNRCGAPVLLRRCCYRDGGCVFGALRLSAMGC